MLRPYSNPKESHESKLVVMWEAPDDGGSPITAYVLERQDLSVDDPEWTVLSLSNSTLTTRKYEDTNVVAGGQYGV